MINSPITLPYKVDHEWHHHFKGFEITNTCKVDISPPAIDAKIVRLSIAKVGMKSFFQRFHHGFIFVGG
jgi:hypothetical protein